MNVMYFAWVRERIGVMLQGGGGYPAPRAGEMLKLARPVQDMLMRGAIEMGHARALLALDAARQIAQMAGIDLPVEPRKRYTWIFTAEKPLSRDLPLTIDPSGVHMRQDGPTTYLVGGRGDPDPAVEFDDFRMDHSLWEDHIWPIIAARIPQFEAIKLVTEWAGHYAYNTLDQNAVLGPHSQVENFLFLNGFSGHGLQQSPAMGRGISELVTYGDFRTLDLTPFGYDRIDRNEPLVEKAVI